VTLAAVRGSSAANTTLFMGGNSALVPSSSNGLGSFWRLNLAADVTNGGIAVSIIGAAATTINTVATFDSTETFTAS
jgi:hypothetical protein